ncbi:hypothetical protein BH23ACT12_BH23ACT12_19270 [soil metagenome]
MPLWRRAGLPPLAQEERSRLEAQVLVDRPKALPSPHRWGRQIPRRPLRPVAERLMPELRRDVASSHRPDGPRPQPQLAFPPPFRPLRRPPVRWGHWLSSIRPALTIQEHAKIVQLSPRLQRCLLSPVDPPSVGGWTCPGPRLLTSSLKGLRPEPLPARSLPRRLWRLGSRQEPLSVYLPLRRHPSRRPPRWAHRFDRLCAISLLVRDLPWAPHSRRLRRDRLPKSTPGRPPEPAQRPPGGAWSLGGLVLLNVVSCSAFLPWVGRMVGALNLTSTAGRLTHGYVLSGRSHDSWRTDIATSESVSYLLSRRARTSGMGIHTSYM